MRQASFLPTLDEKMKTTNLKQPTTRKLGLVGSLKYIILVGMGIEI